MPENSPLALESLVREEKLRRWKNIVFVSIIVTCFALITLISFTFYQSINERESSQINPENYNSENTIPTPTNINTQSPLPSQPNPQSPSASSSTRNSARSGGGGGDGGGGGNGATASPTCTSIAETCNNVDDNCNGFIDENLLCNDQIIFQSGQTVVTLANVNDNIYLKEIENQNGVIEFDYLNEVPLWRLTFINGNQETSLKPSDFSRFIYEFDSDNLILGWTGQTIIPEYGPTYPLSVAVSIGLGNQLQNDEGVGFYIGVDNEAQQALYSVQFPNLIIKPIGDPAKNVLFDPIATGALARPFTDPSKVKIRRSPTTETAMQFLSFYNYEENRQLYLQTLDSEGYSKDFVTITSPNSNAIFGLVQYPENNIIPGVDYGTTHLVYRVEISVLNGNWFDAAKKYRMWALNQPWASRGPIEFSSEFSQTLKNSKLFTLQQPSPLTSNSFDLMKEEGLRIKNFFNLGNNENILLWYLWHTNDFDHDLPTPPSMRDGVINALTSAQGSGLVVIPYLLAHLWAVDTSQYLSNNIANLIPLDIYGQSMFVSLPTPPNQLHTEIDPTLIQSQNLIKNVILDIVNIGFNEGFYWDVWSGFLSERDYSPEHNHPLGGGKYWAKGRILISEQVKSAVKQINPDFFLTSEHFQEFMISNFEMSYTQSASNLLIDGILPIPAWQSVYHDYTMGTDLSIVQPPIQTEEWKKLVRSMQAYLFHMGNLVAYNNWGVGDYFIIGTSTDSLITNDQLDVLNFVNVLVGSFSNTKKYQRFGERLRPLPQSGEYLLERNQLTISNLPSINLPNVQGSVWKANDGVIGIILTNSETISETTTIQINYEDYALAGEYILYENIAGTRTVLNPSITTDFALPVTMESNSLKLYELVPISQPQLSPQVDRIFSNALILIFSLLVILLAILIIVLKKINKNSVSNKFKIHK